MVFLPCPLTPLLLPVCHPNLLLRGLSPWRLKPRSLQQLLTTGEYSARLNGTLQPPQGVPRASPPLDPATVFDLPFSPIGEYRAGFYMPASIPSTVVTFQRISVVSSMLDKRLGCFQTCTALEENMRAFCSALISWFFIPLDCCT